jgi:hypothetical protein
MNDHDKLEALEATIKQAQSQIEELKKPKQWEPRAGWIFEKWGRHGHTMSDKDLFAGLLLSRLLAYVDEYGGNWEADWGRWHQEKFSVSYSFLSNEWHIFSHTSTKHAGTVYMSKECAENLVIKLNLGVVVL